MASAAAGVSGVAVRPAGVASRPGHIAVRRRRLASPRAARTLLGAAAPARAALLGSALPRLALGTALLALGACSVIPIPIPLHGRGPGPAPIADRPIDLDGACVQVEEDGFREDAHLNVRDNRVLALDWTLQVGRRGSCSFRQADFRQTKSRPHIELAARDGSGCRLMVWQEPRRITLAHAGCENRCTPGIYDQAWPVMFDPDTGRCARP